MKTIKQVAIEPMYTVKIPEKSKLEDGVLYISKEYEISIHKCLCGCGEEVALPLDSDHWQLIEHSNGLISLTPSIGNYKLPCKSHYIISKNKANFV
jgi:hypothetical protein